VRRGAAIWLLALAAIAAFPIETAAAVPGGCTRPTAAAGYTRSVRRALLAERDLWGDRLIAAPGGPTYAAANRYLAPLFYAVGANGRNLTASGVYYLALALPFSPYGSRDFALHVADGSEILTRRIGGRHLTIFVGRSGRERYGACTGRLGTATLANGYLPILTTSYVDAAGVRYRQESFAARVNGTTSLVSFVHLAADARGSRSGAVVRLVPSVGSSRAVRVAAGTRVDVYTDWINGPQPAPGLDANEETYGAARTSVARAWRDRLARAPLLVVPEPRVLDAERALLVQELSMTWRYSVGNSYEELSFAEALDEAEVMAEYGYADIAKAILRFTLRRLPERFSNFRAGERLVAGAEYYRLFRDRAYVAEETPELAAAVARLARQIDRRGGTGLLDREAASTDVGTKILGLHEQTAAWQGLLAMGRVWARTGYVRLAARCRALAARLGSALHAAAHRSEQRLPDGSLFVPLALLGGGRPFERLTGSRSGSYWNLLAPYALASGFFPGHGAQARGILRYLAGHGSRLLGLVRSADSRLYGAHRYPVSGTDQVYGLSLARFLADNDQPDRLVLSLYGMLAASMTPDTFVSGEGATVAPLHGELDRTMLLPPNSAANAAFLETLRLLLVDETRSPDGTPTGLELAYATPRAWLSDGKAIRVDRAPTSFGPVSYAIRRRGDRVHAVLDAPAAPALRLRLRLPVGTRLTAVRIAGRAVRFDRDSGTIDLSGRRGRIDLHAAVAATRGPGS
jgi:hypothetical protein